MALNKKLLSVDRSVNTYDSNTKNLLKENSLNITNELLFKIITPKPDDPLLYDGYVLSKEKLTELLPFMEEIIIPNFHLHYYVLETYGNYD